MTPRFEHDCDECVFIGHYGGHDLYRCPQMGMPTIVARYGDDGAEYTSGPRVALAGAEWHATPSGWVGRCATVMDEMPVAAMLGEHAVPAAGDRAVTRWRLHVYRQGDEETLEPRDTFAAVRADLERVGPDEDWVYIERQDDGGEWVRVAFAGFAPDLPDAWEYEPETGS